LSNYGPVDEIWLWDDTAPEPAFDWNAIRRLVRRLQPQTLVDVANVDASAGCRLRSVGSALPVPSFVEQTSVSPNPSDTTQPAVWYPARPCTRYARLVLACRRRHQAADAEPAGRFLLRFRGAKQHASTQRPTDAQGLLAAPDVALLDAYGSAIRSIYASNFAADQPAQPIRSSKTQKSARPNMAVDGKPDTFWAAGQGTTSGRLELKLDAERTFNVVSIKSPSRSAERTTQYHATRSRTAFGPRLRAHDHRANASCIAWVTSRPAPSR